MTISFHIELNCIIIAFFSLRCINDNFDIGFPGLLNLIMILMMIDKNIFNYF